MYFHNFISSMNCKRLKAYTKDKEKIKEIKLQFSIAFQLCGVECDKQRFINENLDKGELYEALEKLSSYIGTERTFEYTRNIIDILRRK